MTSPSDETSYWFPAKRYGWGWGLPRTRQGWAVILGFTAFVLAAALLGRGAVWRWPAILLATLVLLVICLKKGEPTTWRWGGDK